ncbi:HGL015Wp [Eremothecium sinecaudum]|uniref:HGL015Wp n=1 Tax=Eremothecium sinecaudum TaxID=45286 RepID=A0A0X8HVT8_9SACH|nr:HGL015Wp [Eremothecium sinecaudum]AMD22325.1 HGL015Wp [Eremothecium sinecaudum]
MTSAKAFYFRLLRVSMIQLLKAHGFDRAKPSTVDTFTDLYIRFLSLLLQELRMLAAARMAMDGTIYIQDLSLALQNVGLIKPMDLLDVYDENSELPGDVGLQKLKDWCENSPSAVDARLVATPVPELLNAKEGANGKLPNKPLSLIPEYINQLNNGKKNNHVNNEESELVGAMINNGDMDDWVKFMVTRQKVNASREISGKLPIDLESLPAIPGYRWSILSNSQLKNNEEHIPLAVSDGQDVEAATNVDVLLSKLPILRKEDRLDSITLSFEEESIAIDNSLDNELIEDEPASEYCSQQYDYKELDEFEHNSGTGELKLSHEVDSEFQDLEDVQNTFERRDSLVYGSNSFEYNGS